MTPAPPTAPGPPDPGLLGAVAGTVRRLLTGDDEPTRTALHAVRSIPGVQHAEWVPRAGADVAPGSRPGSNPAHAAEPVGDGVRLPLAGGGALLLWGAGRTDPAVLAAATTIGDTLDTLAVPTGSRRSPPGPGVGVIGMDAEGLITGYDRAAQRLLGHHPDAAIGTRLSTLIVPPRLRAAHEAGLRRYTATGVAPVLEQKVQLPALRADGTELTVELEISLVDRPGTGATASAGTRFVGRLRAANRAPVLPAEPALGAQFTRAVVDHLRCLIVLQDTTGDVRWCNERGPELGLPVRAGTTAAQLRRLVHPDDRARADDAARRLAAGHGATAGSELRVDTADGRRTVRVDSVNLTDHPAVHGVLSAWTDVTALRTAQALARTETARLRTLVEAMHTAVVLTDDRQHVRYANAAAHALPGGVPGLAALAAPGGPSRDHEVELADGTVLEVDLLPIADGPATHGTLVVGRDVTERAAARRGLERRNRDLAELARLRSEFVATVSHELRTPLTSMTSLVETLAELVGPTGPAADRRQLREVVAVLARNADRMRVLVADLLTVAGLETGGLPLDTEPVDPDALLADRLAAAGAAHPVPGRPRDGHPTRVLGDRRWLGRMIDQLLAAAGHPPPDPAHVLTRSDGRWWELVLTAPGLTGLDPARLTTGVGRTPAPDHGTGDHGTGDHGTGGGGRIGLGVGLALARAIAQRHGGDLGVSAAGALTIRLPSVPAPASPG